MTPLGHPEERKRRGVSINGGGHSTPPTPPKKNFCRFLGETAEILRFAQDDQNTVGWEGGLLPLTIMCHPERGEGSPPLNGVSPKGVSFPFRLN